MGLEVYWESICVGCIFRGFLGGVWFSRLGEEVFWVEI